MLKKYLLARYALYYKLIEECKSENCYIRFIGRKNEVLQRLTEVGEIIDGIFGNKTGLEIKKEAIAWTDEVDIDTIYKTIGEYGN